MAWYITSGVLQRADKAPASNSILTDITGEGVLVIPEGVTQIDELTFSRCERVMDVIFPRSLERICMGAFRSCINLKRIRLSVGMAVFEEGVFENCPEIRDIILYISEDITDEAEISACICKRSERFNGIEIAQNQRSFQLRDGMLISENGVLLWSEEGVEHAVVPDDVIAIGDGAFKGCRQMQSVQLPFGLKKIGCSAFYRCRSLKSLIVPSSVTDIEDDSFKMCMELKKVDLPEGLKRIGSRAFAACKDLTEMIVPQSVGSLGSKAFSIAGIKRMTLPAVLWSSVDEYVLHRLRALCCPISLQEVTDETLYPKLCAGFAMNPHMYSLQLRQEYIDYIRESAKTLVQTAFDYPQLLQLMCGEKLIGAEDINQFIEEALSRENVELTAAILQYRAEQKKTDEDDEWLL